MREIKFRGLSIDGTGNIRWIYGMYVDGFIVNGVVEATDEYIAIENWCPVDIETIGQYTGLKDKDGTEIYEGDIVKVMDMTLAVVKYSLTRAAYYLDCGVHIGDVGLICQYETIDSIGNIYENPDLLEVN